MLWAIVPYVKKYHTGQEQICQGENICRKNVIYTPALLWMCECTWSSIRIQTLLQHMQFVQQLTAAHIIDFKAASSPRNKPFSQGRYT